MRIDGIALATHAAKRTIGQYEGQRPKEWSGLLSFLDFAADVGVDGIDASSSALPFECADDWWQEFDEAVRSRDLVVASFNCLRSSLCDPDWWQLGFDRATRAIELAKLTGAPTVNIALGVPYERLDANEFIGHPTPPGASRSASDSDFLLTAMRLNNLYEKAAAGVTLVVELHHCSLADSSRGVLKLASLVDPGIFFNPDLINAYWGGHEVVEPWEEILAKTLPYSRGVWHIKNCARIEDSSARNGLAFPERDLWDGLVDHAVALDMFREADFEGWLSIESCGTPDFNAYAERGVKYLQQQLEGQGK